MSKSNPQRSHKNGNFLEPINCLGNFSLPDFQISFSRLYLLSLTHIFPKERTKVVLCLIFNSHDDSIRISLLKKTNYTYYTT